MKKRWEVEEKDTWRLEDLFPAPESWEEEFLKERKPWGNMTGFRESWGKRPGCWRTPWILTAVFPLG